MNKRQAKKAKYNNYKFVKTIGRICKRINKALAKERAQKALEKLEGQHETV